MMGRMEFKYGLLRHSTDSHHYYGYEDDYRVAPIIPRLHKAAKDGDRNAIKELIESGENINNVYYQNGFTPLHYAALNQNLNVVQFLINTGVDVTITDQSGRTARDLLPSHGLQLRYDSMIEALQQHNIEERARALHEIATTEETLPALPYEICHYIAEIEGGTGPWLNEEINEQQNSSSIFCCFGNCFSSFFL
jgi:predicted Fe-Mo cluster-binding NifX family protein